jgi:putative spermidine/putrescine transport system ATP-binding protein
MEVIAGPRPVASAADRSQGRPIAAPPVHLRLERLEKRYGAMAAVDRLDLDVAAGEFIALLGPSGCGKTTTLRMTAGLIPVTTGKITIGGRDVTRLPPYARDLGLVFQNYALFPHMRVAQNIAFGLEMRGISKDQIKTRVEAALRLVHLDRHGDRYPRQLSGGQQQRVALARALVIEPSILLLDEPLSNLDAKLRDAMRVEIREIQQKLGITTLFVTHDQTEALAMCDRIAVMREGRIVQLGTPFDIYERPADPFVADFVGRSNKLHGRILGKDAIAVGPLNLVGATPQGSAQDEDVTVMIRPHRIQLAEAAPPPSAGLNRAAGRVRRTTYVGDLVVYDVEIGALCFQVEQSTRTGGPAVPDGTEVTLTWSKADTLVFGGRP